MKPTPEQCDQWWAQATTMATHQGLVTSHYAALAAEWGAAQQRETDAAKMDRELARWNPDGVVAEVWRSAAAAIRQQEAKG